ncbi:transcription factor with AP2 domain(s), putative (ApiAP2) [Plasmodium malariae]|uniref:Transcription factor with AP2 domain(S), putative (ApiAP2) n=1 Tax=Plasmodium malariae TaxID=5858 RepID=A0A1A8WGE1_PLAMA|nr:transcription factor with AP2 domain(s), putative (ApiAP2) [Plasmodium malariae]
MSTKIVNECKLNNNNNLFNGVNNTEDTSIIVNHVEGVRNGDNVNGSCGHVCGKVNNGSNKIRNILLNDNLINTNNSTNESSSCSRYENEKMNVQDSINGKEENALLYAASFNPQKMILSNKNELIENCSSTVNNLNTFDNCKYFEKKQVSTDSLVYLENSERGEFFPNKENYDPIKSNGILAAHINNIKPISTYENKNNEGAPQSLHNQYSTSCTTSTDSKLKVYHTPSCPITVDKNYIPLEEIIENKKIINDNNVVDISPCSCTLLDSSNIVYIPSNYEHNMDSAIVKKDINSCLQVKRNLYTENNYFHNKPDVDKQIYTSNLDKNNNSINTKMILRNCDYVYNDKNEIITNRVCHKEESDIMGSYVDLVPIKKCRTELKNTYGYDSLENRSNDVNISEACNVISNSLSANHKDAYYDYYVKNDSACMCGEGGDSSSVIGNNNNTNINKDGSISNKDQKFKINPIHVGFKSDENNVDDSFSMCKLLDHASGNNIRVNDININNFSQNNNDAIYNYNPSVAGTQNSYNVNNNLSNNIKHNPSNSLGNHLVSNMEQNMNNNIYEKISSSPQKDDKKIFGECMASSDDVRQVSKKETNTKECNTNMLNEMIQMERDLLNKKNELCKEKNTEVSTYANMNLTEDVNSDCMQMNHNEKSKTYELCAGSNNNNNNNSSNDNNNNNNNDNTNEICRENYKTYEAYNSQNSINEICEKFFFFKKNVWPYINNNYINCDILKDKSREKSVDDKMSNKNVTYPLCSTKAFELCDNKNIVNKNRSNYLSEQKYYETFISPCKNEEELNYEQNLMHNKTSYEKINDNEKNMERYYNLYNNNCSNNKNEECKLEKSEEQFMYENERITNIINNFTTNDNSENYIPSLCDSLKVRMVNEENGVSPQNWIKNNNEFLNTSVSKFGRNQFSGNNSNIIRNSNSDSNTNSVNGENDKNRRVQLFHLHHFNGKKKKNEVCSNDFIHNNRDLYNNHQIIENNRDAVPSLIKRNVPSTVNTINEQNNLSKIKNGASTYNCNSNGIAISLTANHNVSDVSNCGGDNGGNEDQTTVNHMYNVNFVGKQNVYKTNSSSSGLLRTSCGTLNYSTNKNMDVLKNISGVNSVSGMNTVNNSSSMNSTNSISGVNNINSVSSMHRGDKTNYQQDKHNVSGEQTKKSFPKNIIHTKVMYDRTNNLQFGYDNKCESSILNSIEVACNNNQTCRNFLQPVKNGENGSVVINSNGDKCSNGIVINTCQPNNNNSITTTTTATTTSATTTSATTTTATTATTTTTTTTNNNNNNSADENILQDNFLKLCNSHYKITNNIKELNINKLYNNMMNKSSDKSSSCNLVYLGNNVPTCDVNKDNRNNKWPVGLNCSSNIPFHGNYTLNNDNGKGISSNDKAALANSTTAVGGVNGLLNKDSCPIRGKKRRRKNSGNATTTATAAAPNSGRCPKKVKPKESKENNDELYQKAKFLPKITGVSYDRKQNLWVSHWRSNCKTVHKYFSVKKYGFQNARLLAINCRKQNVKYNVANNILNYKSSGKSCSLLKDMVLSNNENNVHYADHNNYLYELNMKKVNAKSQSIKKRRKKKDENNEKKNSVSENVQNGGEEKRAKNNFDQTNCSKNQLVLSNMSSKTKYEQVGVGRKMGNQMDMQTSLQCVEKKKNETSSANSSTKMVNKNAYKKKRNTLQKISNENDKMCYQQDINENFDKPRDDTNINKCMNGNIKHENKIKDNQIDGFLEKKKNVINSHLYKKLINNHLYNKLINNQLSDGKTNNNNIFCNLINSSFYINVINNNLNAHMKKKKNQIINEQTENYTNHENFNNTTFYRKNKCTSNTFTDNQSVNNLCQENSYLNSNPYNASSVYNNKLMTPIVHTSDSHYAKNNEKLNNKNNTCVSDTSQLTSTQVVQNCSNMCRKSDAQSCSSSQNNSGTQNYNNLQNNCNSYNSNNHFKEKSTYFGENREFFTGNVTNEMKKNFVSNNELVRNNSMFLKSQHNVDDNHTNSINNSDIVMNRRSSINKKSSMNNENNRDSRNDISNITRSNKKNEDMNSCRMNELISNNNNIHEGGNELLSKNILIQNKQFLNNNNNKNFRDRGGILNENSFSNNEQFFNDTKFAANYNKCENINQCLGQFYDDCKYNDILNCSEIENSCINDNYFKSDQINGNVFDGQAKKISAQFGVDKLSYTNLNSTYISNTNTASNGDQMDNGKNKLMISKITTKYILTDIKNKCLRNCSINFLKSFPDIKNIINKHIVKISEANSINTIKPYIHLFSNLLEKRKLLHMLSPNTQELYIYNLQKLPL